MITNTKWPSPQVLGRYALEHKEPLALGQAARTIASWSAANSGPARSPGTIGCGSPTRSGACCRDGCCRAETAARAGATQSRRDLFLRRAPHASRFLRFRVSDGCSSCPSCPLCPSCRVRASFVWCRAGFQLRRALDDRREHRAGVAALGGPVRRQTAGVSSPRMSSKSPSLFTLRGANSVMSSSPAQSSRCLISSQLRDRRRRARRHSGRWSAPAPTILSACSRSA